MRSFAIAIGIACAGSVIVDAAAVPAVDVHATCAPSIALDSATRSAHVTAVKSVLVTGLRAPSSGTERFGVDASIAKLELHPTHGEIEVSAEIHIVVSDAHARIQWVGTASATVRERGYHPEHVRAMQREAVEHATRQLVSPVRTQLVAAATKPSV
jgi:hypothetical protein